MQKWLHGRMVCVSVSPAKDDIVGYLRARLAEDEMPDAMDPRLEAEILEKIPENMAEMCVWAMMLGIPCYLLR